MSPPIPGTLGILPAGALGVSFYYHLTRRLDGRDSTVFFIGRSGSVSTAGLRDGGCLRVADQRGVHSLPTDEIMEGDLLQCAHHGRLPEVLLFCPNPDQLLQSLTPCITLLEQAFEVGALNPESLPLPRMVLCANGIYFQRIRQVFLEKLEESTLLGRLPDLWPHLMPRIVGRLMRGVTIQTGIRDGSGPDAVYRPGPPGITRLAGGDASERALVHELLVRRGLRVEPADSSSPTRVEFEKAMVNLVANLLGQLASIDGAGRFTSLTVSEVLDRVGEDGVRELAGRVLEVGRAVRAYRTDERIEDILPVVLGNLRGHGAHTPSSIQWLGLRLSRGEPIDGLTPTELWLLDPLIHYARSSDLPPALAYFEDLKARLASRLRLAIPSRPSS